MGLERGFMRVGIKIRTKVESGIRNREPGEMRLELRLILELELELEMGLDLKLELVLVLELERGLG